ATGPYEIVRYTPDHEVVLGRNPRFREWSAAAQPLGFPDRIVLRTDVEPADGVSKVESGAADWMYGGPPVDQLEDIRTRFASQLHGSTLAATYFMLMNTRVAPFDRLDVRRAL